MIRWSRAAWLGSSGLIFGARASRDEDGGGADVVSMAQPAVRAPSEKAIQAAAEICFARVMGPFADVAAARCDAYLGMRCSTASQSMFEKNASMYFDLSAGL